MLCYLSKYLKINIKRWRRVGQVDSTRVSSYTGLPSRYIYADTLLQVGSYLGDVWLTWEEAKAKIKECKEINTFV